MKDGAEKRERICREGKQGVKPEGREGRGAGEGRRRREGGGEGLAERKHGAGDSGMGGGAKRTEKGREGVRDSQAPVLL